MSVLFENARLVCENEVLENCFVLTRGKKIAYIGTKRPTDEGANVIDVNGNYLSAGFIDLHIHGGNGGDFMDATMDAFKMICGYHSRHGVTSMLATTLAGEENETLRVLEAFRKYSQKIETCNLLGVHLEGPYFSQAQRGAQDSKYIINPQKEQYLRFMKYDFIKRWSIAPELDGALELGRYLADKNIIPSIAHTDADFDQCEKAVKSGYSLVTHIYSCMTGVHRCNGFRYGGTIEAGLLLDELTAEIIADGCHLPASILRLIVKCKGEDKIILTSDAMRGAGLMQGQTTILGSLEHGQEVVIEDGVAKMPDRTAFAGSIASGDRLVRTMVKMAEIPLYTAVKMATINPAKLINVYDKKGSVEVGKDADLILFDEDINIILTMVNGKVIS